MSKTFKDLKARLSKNKEFSECVAELPYLRRKATYRPMKNKEIKSFLKALEKKDEYLINQSLDEILEECVLTIDGEPFNPDEICTQDRTFLLVRIRQSSIGDEAKFPHIYDEDKPPKEVEIDISDLETTYLEQEIKEPVEVSGGVKIYVEPILRKTEKEMEKWIKTHAARDSVIDRRYCALAALVGKVEIKNDDDDEVWDEVDLSYADKVKFLVEYCNPRDLEKIEKAADKLKFGIDMTFHFQHDDYEIEKEEINLLSFFII